jgi:D-alanyl-D-alanine carboxypeptidase (penicillin-binding protein 5/6)
MNRTLFRLLLCALPLCLALPLRAQNAAAYAIADDHSGMILESYNGQKKLQIGSLAKVATAMVVLDWVQAKGGDLAQLAVVPPSAEALNNAAGVGFRAGDRCSLRDLLCAALMQSDNAAAQTLADHVGRSLGGAEPVAAFVEQMNALARQIGMARTRFTNPHGLEEGRSLPYSTAEDLVKLTHYAEDRAGFRFYVSQKEKKISIATEGGATTAYLLKNTNELLGVDSIDGVKTGTTRRAGPCLIISAMRPPDSRQEGEKHFITPRRLNVVVLGAADRFGLARALLEKGWQYHAAWVAAGRPAKWDRRSAGAAPAGRSVRSADAPPAPAAAPVRRGGFQPPGSN